LLAATLFAAVGGGDCIAGEFGAPEPDRDYLGNGNRASLRDPRELFGPPNVKHRVAKHLIGKRFQ
jgi:hypothetical protein